MQPEVVKSKWVRYRAASALSGRGLSFGCGHDPIVPKQALDDGKYCINMDVMKTPNVDICGLDASIIQNRSLDFVFVGARDNAPLRDLIQKLRLYGHLVIHQNSTDLEALRASITHLGKWQEKDTYVRDGQTLGIWKLIGFEQQGILPPKPKPEKRACIARYGAIGDMIMISPIIRLLSEQGYAVTLNVTPYCAEVLKHNPYISNIIIQERDMIPNPELGEYWKEWMGDYDKYINLSESIEGKLLRVEGRNDFYTSKAWRSTDVNYFDQTARLSGFPEANGLRGEIYFSKAEEREAQLWRKAQKDVFTILWALKGSSYHKIYPLLEPCLVEWLEKHPDAQAALVGSSGDANLQFEHPQVLNLAGVANIRQVFCLTKYVDCVVGPESSVINAAGCFDTPKIALLSHSNWNNLCKYWVNDHSLAPENIACYPCHQLHYTLESCPTVDMVDQDTQQVAWAGPVCAAYGVTPERIHQKLDLIYQEWKSKRI